MLLLGAGLFVRFAHWVGARRRRWIDEQIRVQIESGLVASESLKRSRAVSEAVEWVVVALTGFIAAILALDRLGIPLTTLVAPATVIGIGLGFGAQQMVGDLLAGFFLFAEHQFAFGDVIRLSVPGQPTGVTGTVEELTLRVTKVRTAQGELVVVPNSALRQVTNLSKDWSRAVIDIPVSVTEDLDRVTGLLKDMFAAMSADPTWSGTPARRPGRGRGRDHRRGLRAAPPHRPNAARPPVRGGPGDPSAGRHHPPVRRRQLAIDGRRSLMDASTGGTGPDGDDDEPTLVDHPTSASGVRSRWSRKGPPGEDEVSHSALVGFMSVPVHRRVPIRRSTLLMAVAFVGLGALLYLNPPQSTATVTVRGPDGSVYHDPRGRADLAGHHHDQHHRAAGHHHDHPGTCPHHDDRTSGHEYRPHHRPAGP